jgi:hypothetical protein
MPQVVVYNPGIPKHEALIQDIASTPGLNIRRSVKISNLPAPAIDYLAPRQRVAYFFERVVDSAFAEALAA